MSKRAYMFMHEGQFLETNSLVELQTHMDEEQWDNMVAHTVDSYCYMQSLDNAYSGDGGIDKHDRRILRGLKRTIMTLKRVDPSTMGKYNIDELINKYNEIVRKHLEEFTKQVTVVANKDNSAIQGGDIYTARVNISGL